MLRTTSLLIAITGSLALVVPAGASAAHKPPTNGNSDKLGEAPSLSCASQTIHAGAVVSGLVITRAPKNTSAYSYTCHTLITSIVDRYLVASHELKQPNASIPPRWSCRGSSAGASQSSVTCTWSVPSFGVLLTTVFRLKL